MSSVGCTSRKSSRVSSKPPQSWSCLGTGARPSGFSPEKRRRRPEFSGKPHTCSSSLVLGVPAVCVCNNTCDNHHQLLPPPPSPLHHHGRQTHQQRRGWSMHPHPCPPLHALSRVADQSPQFFNQLSSLFHSRQGKNHGSIYLTQKRRTLLSHRPPIPRPLLTSHSNT